MFIKCLRTGVSIDQNVRTGGDPRGNRKTHRIAIALYLYINGQRSRPVDVLIEIKQIGKGRFIPPAIGNSFCHLVVVCHIPEHTFLETVCIGIAGILIPQIHCLTQKKAIPFRERTGSMIERLSLDVRHHITGL